MSVLSVGRVSLALISGLIMQTLVIIIMRKALIAPDLVNLVIIIPMLFFGYVIQLFIAILSGFIAFWTTEINGIFRFIIVLKRFLSGAYFPINLLPAVLVNLSLAFPFVYTFYVPAQLYLGKMGLSEGWRGLGIELLWLFVLYGIIKIVWRFGLRKYESVGI